jgi:anti-anti-sigma regulatory factor
VERLLNGEYFGALIVDLSRIKFIGVAGLGVLLWLNTKCARANIPGH